MEQNVVGPGGDDVKAQIFQPRRQKGALGVNAIIGLLQKFTLRKGRNPRILGGDGHIPGLHLPTHGFQQILIARKAVAKPQTRHAIALGKGLQQEQIFRAAQKRLHAECLSPLGQVQETLINEEKNTSPAADVQNFFHQGPPDHLACGIIGVAEHEHFPVKVLEHAQECFRQGEVVLPVQQIVRCFRAEDLQGRFVLAEAGRQDHGLFRPQGHAAGKNQLRRAVAAENLLFGYLFKIRNGRNQSAAIGIWVAAQGLCAPRYRVLHGLGRSVGVDIGGKIQIDFPGVHFPAVGVGGFVEHVVFLESGRINKARCVMS